MIDLSRYAEPKPHRLRLICWRALNATLFPLLPNAGRCLLLRLFGAAIGKSLICRSVRIHAPWLLRVGDFSCVGPRVELYGKAPITLGDHTVVSQGAYLCTASHDVSSPVMALTAAPIVLGDGAVVGLGAVVTRPVPALTLVAGNPARPLRKRVIRKEQP